MGMHFYIRRGRAAALLRCTMSVFSVSVFLLSVDLFLDLANDVLAVCDDFRDGRLVYVPVNVFSCDSVA